MTSGQPATARVVSPEPRNIGCAPEKAQDEKPIRSSLVSRNVTINNRRTSIRLEPDMWGGLREICRREHTSMHDVCSIVAQSKPVNTSLTAAIRVFIMAYFRVAATEDGHYKAGHGPGSLMLAHRSSTHSSGCSPVKKGE